MGPCNYIVTVGGKELTLNEHEFKGYLLQEGLRKFESEGHLTEIPETFKTTQNAETIRSDQGQIPEGGETVKGSKDLSGKDLQPLAEATPVNAKTKQQTGKIKAKEELTVELKKTGLSEDEKFVLTNSYREYKEKNPTATQDDYMVAKAKAYEKQKALRHASLDKLQGELIEVNGKPNDVNTYVDKAKAVLQHLFPGRELIAHETDAQYREQEGRPAGSMGVAHPDGRIALNLELIRKAGAENTVFHEVIHPIVNEALLSKSTDPNAPHPKLDAAYSRLVSIKNAKGMDAVWAHENLYRDRGLAIMKTEAITEFLTHVADGRIDPTKLSFDLRTKVIDVVNKILKAIGSSKVISTAADLRRLADSIKEGFNTADAKPVEAALGSERTVPKEGVALDKLDKGSEEEKQIKGILARTELPDAEVKQALLDAGHDEPTVDRLMEEVKKERDLGPEELVRAALAVGKQTREAAKLAPPQQTAIAKASLMKTAKRWFFDKQDEVTDVKSIIRQNKGQEEYELDKIYHASNKVRDFWNTVPKEKQLAFILSMERPDLAKNQTPDAQAMSKMYRERLDKVYDTITKAMPDLSFTEDYFPHFWDKPDEVKNFFANSLAKAPLEGGKGFAKQRFFESIVKGLEKGYDLTTTNPEELVRLAEANAWKFKTARDIFDDMKKQGYLKYSTAADLPADWKGVEDKLFNRLGAYVTKEGDAQVAKGQYMMPPEVAKLMNDYLSLGIKSPIKNVVQKFNTIKNTFQLGAGMFHFTTTGIESLINGVTTGIQKISTFKPRNIASGAGDVLSTATILPNIYQSLKRGLQARADYYKGIETADVVNLINANAKIGRQKMYSLDTWYNTKKAFGELKANKDFSKIPKIVWNGLLSIPEALNKPLMENWVPALKVGGYLRSLDSEIMSRGNMTPRELQQAKEKIWDSMDDRLGQVVYDNVFMNKAAKDLAFMSIRSAGWTGGTIRTAVKGIGEIPLSASRLVKGKGLSQRTADLISMPLTVGFFGGMYHYLMTGTAPDSMEDYFFPKDGTKNPDGTDRRVVLPSYMKDYLAYGKKPVETLTHKTSPFLNDIVELYQNKDFYGEKVYNEEDPIFQKGLDFLKHEAESLTPFSFKGNEKDIPRTGKQKVEQFGGIMEAPKERERSETQNAIMQAYVKQMGGFGNQGKTHEEMEQYIARRHLKQYIFNGANWDDLDEDLKEKAHIQDVDKFIKAAKVDPYVNYFKSLKKETKQEVFDAMPEEDQEKYKQYIH